MILINTNPRRGAPLPCFKFFEIMFWTKDLSFDRDTGWGYVKLSRNCCFDEWSLPEIMELYNNIIESMKELRLWRKEYTLYINKITRYEIDFTVKVKFERQKYDIEAFINEKTKDYLTLTN